MRLLSVDQSGHFQLKSFVHQRPTYAILSHTWGRGEDDEVTFQDISQGVGANKVGYRKLEFCSRLAKSHGLEYFWVDTCCIDKSSSSELTESINSMFRWYKEAERCYVYLTDVSIRSQEQIAHVEWKSAFRNSRWHLRGWTLQELLAPALVEFYTEESIRLGDKKSLAQDIHEATGIQLDAIQNGKLHVFSMDIRLSWVNTRQTSRKEDKAYCMLGICGVNMPMIYGEGEDSAFLRLQREIQLLPEPAIHHHSRRYSVMPFERNARFVGRQHELARLKTLLSRPGLTSRASIIGLGGMGKTQVAIELVHRILAGSDLCSVFWVVTTNTQSILQSYLAIADCLEIPGRDDQSINITSLVSAFLSRETVGPWLLVFDNADDTEMWTNPTGVAETSSLLDSLPRNRKGSILFTTRNRKLAVKLSPSKIIEIKEMHTEVSLQLLQNHLPDQISPSTRSETEALLEVLDHLPLAIVQASSYINANVITIREYLDLFSEQDKTAIELLSENFEDEGRYKSISNPIARTWLISFERIQKEDPLAADYLAFMACIEPKNIPQELLPPGASRKKEVDAIGTLAAYSFVTRESANQLLNMHRLVHLTTRNWLTENGQMNAWIGKTIDRLHSKFPHRELANRELWRRYLPVAISILQRRQLAETGKTGLSLACKVGKCLIEDGRGKEASVILEELVTEGRKRLHEDGRTTRDWVNSLTHALVLKGDLKKAESLMEQNVDISKRVLGTKDPQTLTYMNNLAFIYTCRLKLDKSENLHTQVLDIMRRLYGEEDPRTLHTLSNIVEAYKGLGRLKEAEQLALRVLGIQERILGDEHPDTLRSMDHLRSIYIRRKRYAESKPLGEKLLESYRQVFGEEHRYLLNTMHSHAATLNAMGLHCEAIDLIRQCVDRRTRSLGVEHPRTINSIGRLKKYEKKQTLRAKASIIQVSAGEDSFEGCSDEGYSDNEDLNDARRKLERRKLGRWRLDRWKFGRWRIDLWRSGRRRLERSKLFQKMSMRRKFE